MNANNIPDELPRVLSKEELLIELDMMIDIYDQLPPHVKTTLVTAYEMHSVLRLIRALFKAS